MKKKKIREKNLHFLRKLYGNSTEIVSVCFNGKRKIKMMHCSTDGSIFIFIIYEYDT